MLGLVVDDERRPIVGWFRRLFRSGKEAEQERDREEQHAVAAELETNYDEQVNDSAAPEEDMIIENRSAGRKRKLLRRRSTGFLLTRRQRMGLAILSVIISCFMWVFVQVSVNPVTTKMYSVPLAHYGLEEAHERGFESRISPLQMFR